MDLTEYLNETNKSRKFKSDIPDECKAKPCMLGIDEAGRGPVLGPMVYGVCYCPLEETPRLQSMKFADSKTLSEQEREKLFEALNAATDVMGWMVDIISPTAISNAMLKRSKYNLNALSHDSAIGLIRSVIDEDVNVQEIYVDTVGDTTKYQDKLSSIFPGIRVTVAKKADSTYPIVSAASICAKVARDHCLKHWNFPEELEIEPHSWGSGYPGDPKTKSFLNEQLHPVFGFPQMVRFSWSTAEGILDAKAAKVEWDDLEEESSATPSILQFFRSSSVKTEKESTKAHEFFRNHHLSRLTSW